MDKRTLGPEEKTRLLELRLEFMTLLKNNGIEALMEWYETLGPVSLDLLAGWDNRLHILLQYLTRHNEDL